MINNSKKITGFLILIISINAFMFFVGIPITSNISKEAILEDGGHAYITELSTYLPFTYRGDRSGNIIISVTQLYENDSLLGPSHTLHSNIRSTGKGAYSHWGNNIYFSASDNSDPRTNNFTYKIHTKLFIETWVFIFLVLLISTCLIKIYIYKIFLERKDVIKSSFSKTRKQLLLSIGIMYLGIWISNYLQGALFWIFITISLISAVYIIGYVFTFFSYLNAKEQKLLPYHKAVLVICGLMFTIILFEIFLTYLEKNQKAIMLSNIPRLELVDKYKIPIKQGAIDNIIRRNNVLTLPPEWEMKSVVIPGSVNSYYWHESLHVHDENYFRRTTPFPEKNENIFRLLIVGDSMTYGYGIDEKYTYVTLLQELLSENYNIEVINVGKSGWQSEDILDIVQKWVPILKPNLVFYGVVANDFLPSGIGQYTRGFLFPMPDKLKSFLLGKSRFAKFVNDSYDSVLRSVGLRISFHDDILKDFEGYQIRFAKDVTNMNKEVINHGLPQMIAMMLDQYPVYLGQGHMITRVAENALTEAGIEVITLEDYYKRYDGYHFYVSLWEGHADEQGHAIFASLILPYIIKHLELQKYQK